MKLTQVISDLQRDINQQQKKVSILETRKDKLNKLLDLFPNAHYEYGAICLDDIWNKITCMRLSRPYYHWYNAKVSAKFLLSKRDTLQELNGLKIYTFPLENDIANIVSTYNSTTKTRSKEIEIYDYTKLIPDACPKKKQFLKRIKVYLLNVITSDRMTINQNSFNLNEFQKLMLLR